MGVPTAAHVIYIPFVLLIGVVIGFILGGRAARDAQAAQAERDKARAERRAARASRTDQQGVGESGAQKESEQK